LTAVRRADRRSAACETHARTRPRTRRRRIRIAHAQRHHANRRESGCTRGLLRNTAARTVCLGDKRRLRWGADVGRSGGNFVRRSTTAGVQGGGPKSEDAGFYEPAETEVNPLQHASGNIFSGTGTLKDLRPEW